MTPPDEDDDFTALFAGAGGSAPPPDPDFLARLRDLSTDAFVGQVSNLPARAAQGQVENLPHVTAPPTAPRPHERFRMLPLLLRASAAAVAAAVLIGVAVRLTRPDEPAPLAQVLDRVADADTLHLRVTKDGRTSDVWVARSNKLRWDESAERYLIVRGPDAFRVDESSNRVTRGVADFFRPDRPGLDVFALLGLPRPHPDAVRIAQLERTVREGQPVDVYRLELSGRDGPLSVEAEADPATGNLRTVAVRNAAAQVVAALVVLAQGRPVPEEKFAVKPTLAEDGRVGKVVDVQGVVSVKPVAYSRWTPVRPNVLLMPGDWVRADVRGANAATLRLLPQASVVVGPGALLEVVKPTQVKLHEGEAEIVPAKRVPIELTGPDGQKVTVTERAHFRVEKEQIVRVAKEPLWLKGFKGTTTNESLGSLVAKVDGRNVPLSVGTHKVSVEIRDQIARTTIEETFVNHTDAQLEGVFHFPLPQDASIAGFAMWIGDEMVEADVVEKQRAREIYEEIMRERRDPGLLEWTGGNVFKARVWPIFAHSEKRIRITYTQVLPLKGKQYRYSYALNSEMLQLNPLKDLSIDVRLSSAVPLKAVTSPTHSVRATKTDHAARLEFAAQEYTPTKDFEAVIEVADAAPQVAVIPHRRGGDGYFLVQVTPPAPAAGERDLIASADPLNVVLVCDTSASMDPAQRNHQHALAAALLEALTPADTFNLGACDVNADWAFDRPQPATPENVAKARQFLVGRVSLGWTDLDKAFGSALKQVGAKGHVVYLGDGIVTTGDANPQSFVSRLAALYKASGTAATFHAVALGSAFEPGVMAAIGSLGGGSVRRVTAEQGPVPVALDLLGEITKPPVRDLRVEFRGWKTASVYPEVLANLVPGTQQILIGRYLPEGKDQTGEVVVTGKLNGQEVRYAAAVTLADAEQGNSFLPRLWARMRLDQLLAQPQTDAVRDEVIALSEEFHIMTPYTSFLVLESDADRERFKVTRRFLMRDGEQFFAQGRAKAEYDLAREQMKKAGLWRTGLRRDVLNLFVTLGRNPAMFRPRQPYYGRGGGGGKDYYYSVSDESEFLGGALGREVDELTLLRAGTAEDFSALGDLGKLLHDAEQPDAPGIAGEPGSGPEPAAAEPWGEGREEKAIRDLDLKEFAGRSGDWDGDGLADFRRGAKREFAEAWGSLPDGAMSAGFARRRGLSLAAYKSRAAGRPYYQSPQRWFDPVFPNLPAAAKPATPPKSAWLQEARDLARSLLRRDALAKLPGGLKLEREVVSFDPPTGTATGRDRRLEFVSPNAWAVRSAGDHAATHIEWYDGKERAAYRSAFGLGRVRPAVAMDKVAPLNLSDYSTEPLDESYSHLTAAVEKAGDKSVLVLKQGKSEYEMRFTIDPAKRVVLKVEQFQNGKPANTTTYSDFVEAGGMWWAARSESLNEEGKRLALTTQAVATLGDADYAAALKAATAGREAVQFLRSPEPKVADAKKAIAGGKPTFDDHFALLNHFAGYQQWAKAGEHLDAIEKLAAGKPGVRWLRTVFLQASRRGEELRVRLLAEADKVPALSTGDRLAVAEFLHNQAQAALAPNEVLALIDRLAPVYSDLPKGDYLRQRWQHNRAYALSNAGRADEALALWKEIAVEHPLDSSAQSQYANALFNRGDHEEALAWLRKQFGPELKHERGTADWLRGQYADWLERLGRFPDLIAFTHDWTKQVPETDYGYQRHLSALVRGGEAEKAASLVAAWLKDAQVTGDVPAAAQARFRAAAHLAVGRGHNLYTDRIDDRWLKPLTDAALFFDAHPTQYALADVVTEQQHLRATDEGKAVVKEMFARLVRELAETPTPRLSHRVAAALRDGADGSKSEWTTIAGVLRDRWAKETDPNQKHYLADVVRNVSAAKLDRADLLALLRQQTKDGPAADRPAAASHLFDALLAGPWAGEHEAEAFALLADLGPADQPEQRAVVQVGALHRLTDRMVQARTEALKQDFLHPEKLTRAELTAKQTELLNAARRGLTERLAKVEATLPEALRPWAKAERLYLLVRTGADPKPLAAECWEFLGAAPKARREVDEPSPRRDLDDLLADRFLAMALSFAAKNPELVERTLKYLDAGIAAEPNEPGWKAAMFQLLVALDRPRDLEAVLSAWSKAGDVDGRWRTALGYVLAEQGKLNEAIAQFEAVEKGDELGHVAYRALAGWYMAVNKRDAHERALVNAFKAIDEDTLARLMYAKVSPWTRGGGRSLPTELDPDTLRVFAALFEKSTYPANYLHQLRAVYGACRDFRLLVVMADAVIGQSAGKIYPFLQAAQSVLNEVRDEATADELHAHVEKLRPTAKSATDHRALDLLEMQVRRRAAEVKNQPGPHAAKALAAMRRAFDREWADGERLMMSNLLRDLGTISREDLAAEQLRELRDLHAAAKPGTFERMHMAHNTGTVLGYQGRHKDGLDLMRKALDEYAATHGGAFPADAESLVQTMVSFHQQLNQHGGAEDLLVTLLKKPANDEVRRWLTVQLYEVYHRALETGQAVELGEGQKLYKAVEPRLVKAIDEPDPNHRGALVNLLCRLYRTAKMKTQADVAADAKAFAHKTLPSLLKKNPANHESIVGEVARALRDVAGQEEGIVFLLDRIDEEPAWFRLNNTDGWSQYSGWLAEWRSTAQRLPVAVEDRLLKLVLAELRRDLRTRTQRSRNIYYAGHTYYWKEKVDAFARVAEDVLAEKKDSGEAIAYVAEYLFHGCERPDRAIEVLSAAHARKLLSDDAQVRLVTFLHWRNRHAESLPVVVPLVARAPDVLHYRSLLCQAYFHTGRQAELRAAFAAAEEHFRHKDRWSEAAMASLAETALACKLFERSAAIYGELIPLHQRSAPNRGVGNGRLSTYYTNQAYAYAGLGKTAEAVDAAGGAVVSWGNRVNNRTQALATLKAVLGESPDLEKFVAHLNAQLGETGLINPVVRKALGQVYFDRGNFPAALTHLQLAMAGQPNDAETQKLLIECHDKMKNPAGAVAQIHHVLDLTRRDIKLYEDLGNRYAALGESAAAERAFTSIVEVLPNESEGHALLAEIRQRQDRWADAIGHWEQVARIRSLEPTGLLGLAAAQLHERQYEKAAETIGKLKARTWPAHFPNAAGQIAELERRLRDAPK